MKIVLSFFLFLSLQNVWAGSCPILFAAKGGVSAPASEIESMKFSLPGVKTSSLIDPSGATGATLIYFEEGALTVHDARGGSVASAETTLLDFGHNDAVVDGITLAGGSIMGLEASSGVRSKIYEMRKEGSAFDSVPSIPSAVIYDYSGRIFSKQDARVYPSTQMGRDLVDALQGGKFLMGRTGAGRSATVNKIGKSYWGGQGSAFGEIEGVKIFVAVVLNACGDCVYNGKSLGPQVRQPNIYEKVPAKKQNTTLSVVVTDANLSANQLKRLAVMVHTNMAAIIQPFHTYTDGDILFASSLQKTFQSPIEITEDIEWGIQIKAMELMQRAIFKSVSAANKDGILTPGDLE